MKWIILLLTILVIHGCGPEVRLPSAPKDVALTGIAHVIASVALIAAWVGSFAVLTCAVAFFFVKVPVSIVAKYLAASVGLLVTAGLLYWLAQHWVWAMALSGITLVGSLLCYGYLHRVDIEKRFGVKTIKAKVQS